MIGLWCACVASSGDLTGCDGGAGGGGVSPSASIMVVTSDPLPPPVAANVPLKKHQLARIQRGIWIWLTMLPIKKNLFCVSVFVVTSTEEGI